MKRRYRRLPPKQVSGNEMFFKPTVQRKLKVGKIGDAYEIEADAMADKVISQNGAEGSVQKMEDTEEEMQQKPLSDSISTVQREGLMEKDPLRRMEEEEPVQQQEEEEVQTQSEEEEEPVQMIEEEESVQQQEEEEVQTQSEEDEEPLQMVEDDEPIQQMEEKEAVQAKSDKKSKSGPSFERRLRQSKGKGNKMEAKVRSHMETRFGADFGGVHIHTDSNAIQMSKELGAQAFTHGRDIYFNEGKYNPNSSEGQHLLAHELTHTIQQKGGRQTTQKRELNQSSDKCESQSARNSEFGPKAKICFETNSYSLTHDDEEKLNSLSSGINSILKQQNVTLDVVGYADHRGDPDYNRYLSRKRAEAVASFIGARAREGRFDLSLNVIGGGEIGDVGMEDSWQLRENRIVLASIPGYNEDVKRGAGQSNLRDWLEMGLFHEAWGGDRIENGDVFICLLELAVKPTFDFTSPKYGDSVPNDIVFMEWNLKNFGKQWNEETYKRNGGRYENCSFFDYRMVDDWIRLARQYILSHPSCYAHMQPQILDYAAWWSQRDGLPDMFKAERQIRRIYDHFIEVKRKAHQKNRLVDHPCENMEQILILNEIMAEAQGVPGTVYNCFME